MKNNETVEIVELSIYDVSPGLDQPRKEFNEKSIENLSESISEYGVIQPIVVRKVEMGYEIIAGERRWRASKLAGLKKIPAIVKELEASEIAQIALIENIQRENLNAMEEAWAFKSLIDKYSLTQDKIATILGKSRPYVANTIRLLNLDERVRDLIMENKLTSGHGRTILGLNKVENQIVVANLIIEKSLSVRETERLVKDYNKNIDKKVKKKNDPMISEIEETLREHLGTKVQIKRGVRKGKIEIEYYSDEELERIIEKIK